MGKDDSKPRGKMSSYAYFVQTCREEHKKSNPSERVVFSDFSRKCSERWRVCHVISSSGNNDNYYGKCRNIVQLNY